MRSFKMLPVVLFAVILAAGCQSVSYLPRSLDIMRDDATQEALNAELKINMDQKVSAVSDLQDSKKAALVCAYYNCIKENNIDVVVDPIVKYTKYSMFVSKDVKNAENAKWWKPQYKAEIVGYAGKYVKVETSAEQVNDFKDVDMNDVVKYKMVTDPDFYKSYYQSKESNVINVYTDGNRDSSKKVKKPINQLQK